MASIQAEIKAKLAAKDEKIAELEAAVAEKRAYIQRMRERNKTVIATCQEYARESLKKLAEPVRPALKAMTFKRAKRTFNFAAYEYPSAAGTMLFTPEHLVYGKGIAAALFVLGRSESGEKIKLRWYDKDSYVGRSFKHSAYAWEGSTWLVGYAIAKDGAVDLVAAFPLCLTGAAGEETVPEPAEAPVRRPSFDELIREAEKKKQSRLL